MNYGEGIISKIYSWIWNPSNDDATIKDYAYGLVAVILLAYLWSTVVKQLSA
jgi:hypothetical protein